MWFDCGNVFLNLDNVDYLCFEEVEQGYRATIYFASGESLNFEHQHLDTLKSHFRKIFEVKNGTRTTTEMG